MPPLVTAPAGVPVMGPENAIAPQAPAKQGSWNYQQVTGQSARRPGLFARLGRLDWERISAALRDDPQYLRDLLAERQQAARDAREAAEAEATRRQAKNRNGQIEAMIASQPPEIQAFARAFPEQYAQAVARQSQDGGWESGQGYSHAFRVNPDGTVTMGDPLPLRPRAAVQGYVMPGDTDEWDYSD